MEHLTQNVNLLWVIIAAALVMFMQAGFTALETGLTRAKNSINVAMKNMTDFILSILIFFFVGYALMFGEGNGFVGWSGFGLSGHNTPTDYAYFVFQATFAGTAATIISGAVAERIRFVAYAIISIIVTAFIYPISGHWIWSAGGWLAEKGMIDFAGSTVVHSLGGWVGLAGAIVLGPRLGRFSADGKANKIHGHNLVLAVVGIVILWFGWFGFNGGSTLEVNDSITIIVANTMLAAAAGGVGCFLTSSIVHKGEIQIEKMLNGIVAGLVGITAGCAVVEPAGAIFIGITSGVIVFFSEEFLLHVLKIDDPINVISAHGVAGAWGTIALALAAPVENLSAGSMWAQLGVQSLGVFCVFAWGFGTGLLLFMMLKFLDFLRVSPEAELMGLNVHEHGATSGLLRTMEAMNSIIQAYAGKGESDLTQRIEVETGSEQGEIADAFNQLMNSFHNSIYDIKTAVVQIEDVANLMSQSSEQMINEARSQEQNAATIQKAIKDMVSIMAKTRDFTLEASDSSAKAMELANAGTKTVNETLHTIESVNTQVDLTEDMMREVSVQVEGMVKFLESIDDIADQTNLLALNAAIESARAGEAGRGFSVVADEVRSLSAKTQSTTQQIKELMKTLTNVSEKARNAMLDCKTISEKGMSGVTSSSECFGELMKFFHQINQRSSDVMKHIESQDITESEVNECLESIDVLQQHSVEQSETVASEMSKLSKITHLLKDSMKGLKVSDERSNDYKLLI